MITKEKTREFIGRAYRTACEHGFHDEKMSVEHFLMLVITEISEAVEADRRNLHANLAGFEKCIGLTYNDRFKNYVKESIEDEISDVCIRLYDLCGALGIEPLEAEEFDFSDEDVAKKGTFCEQCFLLSAIICEVGVNDYEYKTGCALALVQKMCEDLGIDLERHIELKMKYNESRPKRHGKKY